MIVFKTFLKVMKSCLATVIIFTVILVLFGAFNFQTNETSLNFVASKPDVLIINNDVDTGITKGLIDYISDNCNIIEVEDDQDSINDALFYRDVNYIISIPKGFRESFLDGDALDIEVKSTGDYQASLASMMLEKYLRMGNIYLHKFDNEDEETLVTAINETLKTQARVSVSSELDTNNLSKLAFFYNFANYSILAGCVYVICLILSIFKQKNIVRRTMVSSINYKKHNRYLLLSNGLFVILLWLFYMILSYFLVGDIVFTTHGILCIINFFVFSMVSLALAFLIGTLITDKNAVNGIVNVISLGSSFLCGAFVPMEFLPDIVLKIAHVLPSYYYIKNNNLISVIDSFDFEALRPVIINMLIMLCFMVLFVILTNVFSKKRQREG